MSQKPYIYFTEDGEDFILQRGFPNYIGKITHAVDRSITHFPVAGYYLYVSINSTLKGNYMPSLNKCDIELTSVSDDMSRWALEFVINDNPKYKDFKICYQPQQTT